MESTQESTQESNQESNHNNTNGASAGEPGPGFVSSSARSSSRVGMPVIKSKFMDWSRPGAQAAPARKSLPGAPATTASTCAAVGSLAAVKNRPLSAGRNRPSFAGSAGTTARQQPKLNPSAQASQGDQRPSSTFRSSSSSSLAAAATTAGVRGVSPRVPSSSLARAGQQDPLYQGGARRPNQAGENAPPSSGGVPASLRPSLEGAKPRATQVQSRYRLSSGGAPMLSRGVPSISAARGPNSASTSTSSAEGSANSETVPANSALDLAKLEAGLAKSARRDGSCGVGPSRSFGHPAVAAAGQSSRKSEGGVGPTLQQGVDTGRLRKDSAPLKAETVKESGIDLEVNTSDDKSHGIDNLTAIHLSSTDDATTQIIDEVVPVATELTSERNEGHHLEAPVSANTTSQPALAPRRQATPSVSPASTLLTLELLQNRLLQWRLVNLKLEDSLGTQAEAAHHGLSAATMGVGELRAVVTALHQRVHNNALAQQVASQVALQAPLLERWIEASQQHCQKATACMSGLGYMLERLPVGPRVHVHLPELTDAVMMAQQTAEAVLSALPEGKVTTGPSSQIQALCQAGKYAKVFAGFVAEEIGLLHRCHLTLRHFQHLEVEERSLRFHVEQSARHMKNPELVALEMLGFT